MATNKVIKGEDFMLFERIGSGQTATYKSIALATSHSLSLGTELTETSTKDNPGYAKTYTPKSSDWELSTDNLVSFDPSGDGIKDMFRAWKSKTSKHYIMALKSNASFSVTNGWTPDLATSGLFAVEGDVYVTNLQVTAQNGENATYTVTLKGTGELDEITIN